MISFPLWTTHLFKLPVPEIKVSNPSTSLWPREPDKAPRVEKLELPDVGGVSGDTGSVSSSLLGLGPWSHGSHLTPTATITHISVVAAPSLPLISSPLLQAGLPLPCAARCSLTFPTRMAACPGPFSLTPRCRPSFPSHSEGHRNQ